MAKQLQSSGSRAASRGIFTSLCLDKGAYALIKVHMHVCQATGPMSVNAQICDGGTSAASRGAASPAMTGRHDPRTRKLLEAPITATLLGLAIPNVVVMVAQASVGLIETYFIGKLGTDALA